LARSANSSAATGSAERELDVPPWRRTSRPRPRSSAAAPPCRRRRRPDRFEDLDRLGQPGAGGLQLAPSLQREGRRAQREHHELALPGLAREGEGPLRHLQRGGVLPPRHEDLARPRSVPPSPPRSPCGAGAPATARTPGRRARTRPGRGR
jgi:hypothetical protein